MTNINDNQIQEGDIRNVKRVDIKNDWNYPNQLSHPASDEKVQAYLKNKNDKPAAFPKLVIFIFVVLLVLYGIVHGICNLARAAKEESAKNYANVITVDDASEASDEAEKTELQPNKTYMTDDKQFEFTYDDGKYSGHEGITITAYLGDSKEVTVPKEIQGFPVLLIKRSTFEGNSTIEKVTIEAEITTGGDIFRDCEALKEVIFPATIEKLGYTTFYNTPSLETVTVHKGCEVHDGFGGYNASPTVNYID